MKIFVPIFLAICAIAQTNAQPAIDPGDTIKTVTLSDTIMQAAIDRVGDFYAVTSSRQIQRFDKDGKLTLSYQAEEIPAVFDPRDGARLFVYYRADQHYEFLTPSFQPIVSYKVDPAFAIQPWLICPSGEYKLWILDKADHSLKKIDVKAAEVEIEVVIDPALIQNTQAFTSMREYQNFVFLLDPSEGIHIFNSLGKHIKTIAAPGVRSFNFLGEEMYYLRRGTLEFFNLFSAESRQLEVDPKYTDALLTDERMILFTPEKIDIYPFRP